MRRLVLADIVRFGKKEIASVARHFELGLTTVKEWYIDYLHCRKTESARKRRPKGFSRIPPQDLAFGIEALNNWPLNYMDELCDIVLASTGNRYQKQQMSAALISEGYTRKYRALEQSKPLRMLYMANVWRYYSAHQLVFFDESHVKPEDVRR